MHELPEVPHGGFFYLFFALFENIQKLVTLLGACRHAPAAVASPSWDIDELPV
jgi:hypothetical protein